MSTPKKILCPHCRLSSAFDARSSGSTVTCRYCGDRFRIPSFDSPDSPRHEQPPSFHAFPSTTSVNPSPADIPEIVHPTVPSAPQFEVIEEEPDYDLPRSRPGRGRFVHDEIDVDEYGAEYAAPPAADSISNWQTVATGISLIQWGYILGLILLFVFIIVTRPIYDQLGQVFFGPVSSVGPDQTASSRRELFWAPPFLFLSLICCGVSLLLILVGQLMCCTAPSADVRSGFVSSVVFLVISAVMLLFQSVHTASFLTQGGFFAARSFFDYCSGIIATVLFLVSHGLFAGAVRETARFFRNRAIVRQANYYLGFYLTYTMIGFVCGLINTASVALRTRAPGSGTEWSAAAGLCWSCFGAFLLIALLSLLHQTRTFLQRKLSTRRRNLRSIDLG